jgi:hypothetical protein
MQKVAAWCGFATLQHGGPLELRFGGWMSFGKPLAPFPLSPEFLPVPLVGFNHHAAELGSRLSGRPLRVL